LIPNKNDPQESQTVANLLDQTLGQLVGANAHVGADLVHIPTWKHFLEVVGEPLLGRIYTAKELAFAAGRIDRLATRLAAKEAALKVLRTGIRGISLREIEVTSSPEGAPSVVLHGRAATRARRLGLAGIRVSLSHEHHYACAMAMGHTAAHRQEAAA
jgi:phosphopantetheine--protein transferase-like protein